MIKIVAELSANHGGEYQVAEETIRAMARAGADAVKLQTYTADTLSINCNNEYFTIKEGLWKGETLYSLYQKAHTPWEWHKSLQKLACSLGLEFFSTPFDETAVDFLETLNVPYYKVASFEIRHIPLIKYIAKTGKPVVLSSGIATLDDLELAIKSIREVDRLIPITILKCTSAYPARLEDANLFDMMLIRDKFGVDVGISDHTIGFALPTLATAMGATMIEKHFILNKNINSPDAAFSLDPDEFSDMVSRVRRTENILYGKPQDTYTKAQFGRSVFVVSDVNEGDIATKSNVRVIRPAYGEHPVFYDEILGSVFNQAVKRGTPFNWGLVE